MNTNIKRGIVSGALSLSLLGGTVAGVAAQTQGNQTNQGGAAGLIAAVVQANVDDSLNDLVDVTVTDSFNNLTALSNILNNSPILSNNDVDIVLTDVVDIQNVLNNNDVLVVVDDVIGILNDNNVFVSLDDVIGVVVLDDGDLVVLTQ